MNSYQKKYKPIPGLNDPCAPVKEKTYETPPNLYLGVQQPDLEQYPINEALFKGTLWPALYGPYETPKLKKNPSKKGGNRNGSL